MRFADGDVHEGPYGPDFRRTGNWVIRYGARAGSIAGFTVTGLYEDGEENGCWITRRPDGTSYRTLYEDGERVGSSCVR